MSQCPECDAKGIPFRPETCGHTQTFAHAMIPADPSTPLTDDLCINREGTGDPRHGTAMYCDYCIQNKVEAVDALQAAIERVRVIAQAVLDRDEGNAPLTRKGLARQVLGAISECK